MSIKENQLPTAQEVTENNLIRTVDEYGASQNMTVEQLGGLVGGDSGILLVNQSNDTWDKTADEIFTAFTTGTTVMICDSYFSNYETLGMIQHADDSNYAFYTSYYHTRYEAYNGEDYPTLYT